MSKIRIALAGLKGGIGKTTLSMVLGTILGETYKKKVCFVDCDYYQYPITAQKQRDDIFIDRHPELAKEIFESRGIEVDKRIAPPIYKMKDGFDLTVMPEAVEEAYPDYDVYIYDFMGSQGYEAVYIYLTKMDYIILPTVIDSVNSRPTFYWMQGINFGLKLVNQSGEETPRLKTSFLLFNQFNDENCDLALKAWLEDEAMKANISILQNTVLYFRGVSRDFSCVSRENMDFFVSVYLQPSNLYMEETNVHQVAEEIFLETGIIEDKKVAPQVIKDPIILHKTIIEDLKQQLDELTELTGNVTGAMSDLSEKHKEILTTYQTLCSMSVDEIKRVFGRTPVPVPEVSEERPVEQAQSAGETHSESTEKVEEEGHETERQQ